MPEKIQLEFPDIKSGLLEIRKTLEQKLSLNPGPVIALVAGGSASGKTTAIARGIAETFPSGSVVLSMDDYYRGAAYVSSHNINFDEPDAIDIDLLKTHLNDLKAGKPVQKPIYSFKSGEREGYSEFLPAKLIVVEGLFALNNEIEKTGDLNIFVDTGSHGRLLRKMFRDTERSSWSPIQNLEYALSTVEPMYTAHILPTAKNADIIIKNEYDPEIESKVLKTWERQLKFRFGGDKELQKKIILLGAEHIATLSQNDSYYMPKDKMFASEDEIIRVRRENEHIYLTYKGPRTANSYERGKFELEINKHVEEELIPRIYYKSAEISKTREIYNLGGLIFTIDAVSKIAAYGTRFLGNFLEIRLPKNDIGREYLDKIVNTMNLSDSDVINTSYYLL